MRTAYGNSIHRASVDLWQFDQSRDHVPGSYLITRVEVAAKHRGKGVASALMAKVLQDADREHVTLYLTCEPDGTGLDYDALWRWYRRLGFQAWRDGGPSMIRHPKER